MTELQDLYLRYALDEGVVLVDEQLGGVIALLPPTAARPSEEFQQRVVELHGARFTAVASTSLPAAPEGHWSLETLGVHPERQGEGLGQALIHAGLGAVSTSAHHGVALETSDERNVRLYERAGFSVCATTRVDDGPMVYSMVLSSPDRTGSLVAAEDAIDSRFSV
ncbi:GNAT family N-acetyltransferase [Nocardioides panzhihuensis]|uniref:Ribosomal protein S18 acetylase RimI-like enzyme n=1 Tax=Nocardioides panzhihuensis TaxID=860243 RepID=A0A7Z0IQK5_9ACTN|nr:GNAT family N-acetyltransferase [Nocardioides panzhihuensis]NYI75951.1 ribosomal protein S18 acetylase RimI-like enzyme [Nocardioides panzhihuensis]